VQPDLYTPDQANEGLLAHISQPQEQISSCASAIFQQLTCSVYNSHTQLQGREQGEGQVPHPTKCQTAT